MQAAQTMRAVHCRPAAAQRRGLARPQRAVLAVPRAQQQQGSGPAPAEAAAAVAQAAAAAEQQAAALADAAAQALEAEQQQQQDDVAVVVSETAYVAEAPSEQQAAQHAVAPPPAPAGPGGLPIGRYLSHPGVRIAGADGLGGLFMLMMLEFMETSMQYAALAHCSSHRLHTGCRASGLQAQSCPLPAIFAGHLQVCACSLRIVLSLPSPQALRRACSWAAPCSSRCGRCRATPSSGGARR